MHQAIMRHWAPVFAEKHVDETLLTNCLDSVFPRRPRADLPILDAQDLKKAARLAGDSAPGPDGLPYRAWLRTPDSFDILADVGH
eukprot:7407084-Pyramimonas_sp.AAC.1